MSMTSIMTAISVPKDRSLHTGQPQKKVIASMPRILPYCTTCLVIDQCTQSKNQQKMIQRHIWQDYLDVAKDLRHNYEIKDIYGKRKETIERVFADAKEKHGMRWTTLKGLKKLSLQAMLTFAALNLKKLASWTWKSPAAGYGG